MRITRESDLWQQTCEYLKELVILHPLQPRGHLDELAGIIGRDDAIPEPTATRKPKVLSNVIHDRPVNTPKMGLSDTSSTATGLS